MRPTLVILFLWGFLSVASWGQEPPLVQPKANPAPAAAPKVAEPELVMRPDRAVAIAVQDAETLALQNPAFPLRMRYVMVNDPDEDTRPAISFTANTTLLFNSEPLRPLPVGTEGVWRVDLAEYAGHDETTLRRLMDTWDRMQDPQFYLPTDDFKTISTPWYFHTDGKRYNKVQVRVVVGARHADVDGRLARLVELTGCAVPIISIGQFERFLLNSDFGGLYPQFRGFEQAPEKGTAEEAFLLRANIDLQQLGARNSDQRVVCYGIPTGQPRLIEYMNAAVTRPGVGPTIATITRDFFAGPIDQNKHPLENLAERKHDGTEIFLPTPEGGLEFALFNGQGGFVKSAPPNLAADRTIPAPWLPILQGPSSCIRCHSQTNAEVLVNSIYQPAPNYVTYLRNAEFKTTAGVVKFDVFKESGDSGKALKRLVSLYNGETTDAFAWAGRTYAKFVFDATGVPFEQACRAMLKVHDDWLYSFVTPKKACLTLGYKVETEEQAVLLFNQICPIAPEPLRVTQIRAWDAKERPFKIPIDDWLTVYPEVALRVQIWESAQQKAQVPAKQQPQKENQNDPAKKAA